MTYIRSMNGTEMQSEQYYMNCMRYAGIMEGTQWERLILCNNEQVKLIAHYGYGEMHWVGYDDRSVFNLDKDWSEVLYRSSKISTSEALAIILQMKR